MHKENFITWYYSNGLKALFRTFANLLHFLPRFFSISLLIQTLFYPWRGKVVLEGKKSFAVSCLKTSGRFFLRIFGFFVRSATLFLGLLSWIIVFVLGILIIFFYFAFPGILLVMIAFLFSNLFYVGLIILFFQIIFLIISINRFKKFDHVDYQKVNIVELNKLDWFYRIYNRLGVRKNSVPKRVLGNYQEFLKFIDGLGVTLDECEKTIFWEIDRQLEREEKKKFFSKNRLMKIRPIGLNWAFGKTFKINNFSKELTKTDDSSYSRYPFVGYQEEMDVLENVLIRKNKNNVIISGESGSGRRMLTHEFARRIREGEYDSSNFIKSRIITFYLNEAVIKAENKGFDVENFLEQIFYETACAGNIILVIRKFEMYFDNPDYNFSLTKLINKYASLPFFRIIIVTDDLFLEKNINLTNELSDYFELLNVGTMNEDETLQVLFNYFYGDKHTPFTFQALRQIIINSGKYMVNTPLPLRAINLAKEVLDFWEKDGSRGFVTAEMVDKFTKKKINISYQNFKEHRMFVEDVMRG